MATEGGGEDFVTIVPVGEGRPVVRDSTFVTVLTVGAAAGAEVIVRRPKGERLGLGLKFEGGSAAAEKVRRLLVQSCAENSPAANACAPWGKLIPGDEILAIDGVPVSELTRIDCVRRLKDSDEALTLLVRHFESDGKTDQNTCDTDLTGNTTIKQATDISRPTTLPPPVPPRKLGKKNSFKDKPTLQTVGEQNSINRDGNVLNDKELNNHNGYGTLTKLSRKSSFDSHIHRQSKEGIASLKKGSPEEVRRLVRRLSDGKTMPPEAEVYIDLLSNEWERCLLLADAESDDTGSSISTVVDRLGSMTSSVENSIPSTPTMQPKTIDIQKVLNCIENIDSNILKDITSNKFLERPIDKQEINKEAIVLETTATINGKICYENTPVSSEGIISQPQKLQYNDKNNNNTIGHTKINSSEIIKASEVKKNENKPEVVPEKPKPMPRNTKVERSVSEKKPRPIPVPDTPPPPVPESLLTPTKKNCIETWLQRSEAEMNNIDKMEESVAPEALPRLIDFVPKSQFKECTEPPLTRPTAPPPPPPTETREDGSGASLDTIGELDESSDVTDNAKPIVAENETKNRKSTFERSFWEDRINKSDAEDKSLSNDETPLPSCPRQPPDGVETPSDAIEKMPELATRVAPRITTKSWPTSTRTRFSYLSRTQDARSEASVKDKIAMFSNDTTSTDRLDKCGTLPTRISGTKKSTATYSTNYPEVSTLDRRLTRSQDNLDEVPRSYKIHRHIDRPEVLGAVESVPVRSVNTSKTIDTKPLFYGSTTTLPTNVDTYSSSIYHARSISDDNGNKNVPAHKSNLEYLIEQRKKSMSKLRGLVISEVQAPIVDLPEIKVQDNYATSFLLKNNNKNQNNNIKENKTNNTKPVEIIETKWKMALTSNNIPKYSPAFKRKSLQVYTPLTLSKESTPERKFSEKIDLINNHSNSNTMVKPLRASLGANNEVTRVPSTLTYQSSLTSSINNNNNKSYKNNFNFTKDYKNVDIKICTTTDVVDSDNDSAMSSTQSSYRSSASSPMQNLDAAESDSSRLSPKISNYTLYSLAKSEIPTKSSIIEKNCEEYIKRSVCRSVSSDTNVSLCSSAGSGATSGSQASCSSLESSVADSDKKKVVKSYNIDTLNRRNILASAKCRSGRDEKLKSPVIETKFSHELPDRSPSPSYKSSERLSTLTSTVSAVSNKGENRRRNKVIAETDSDSDSDVNVRQRKNDYKNSRIKRNTSASNKTKQVELNNEVLKSESSIKNTAESIIREIKRTEVSSRPDNHISKVISQTNNNIDDNNEIKEDEKQTASDVFSYRKNNKIESPIHVEKKMVKMVVTKKVCENESSQEKSDCSSIEDTRIPSYTIQLKRGSASGVGLILAGGIDCEAKDVTVHRVLADSVADKAGLKRGAKVKSINGYSMTGLTHAQSVTILKEQRAEVVIEIEHEIRKNAIETISGSEKAESMVRNEDGTDSADGDKGSVVTVVLEKAGGGAGLGFGLDGGRDSPNGDRPLTIKKLFAGGAAAQSGCVVVGAELLSAGGQSMEGFTRTQAWAALKALPAGPVALVLRNPKTP
ncbi:uncharacterized protein LOC106135505 [Amyelois transitella]|uniref:uncharacterized protein LOC106135505 n=1 Tax=Amyelois transitella TaxID=680683 RepID=UPI0029907D8B|nr:uncharacterized protein LOC106135505 [Amyelois transitella]